MIQFIGVFYLFIFPKKTREKSVQDFLRNSSTRQILASVSIFIELWLVITHGSCES